MKSWDYERFERILEDFLGSGDPLDPKEVKRARILRAATELFIRQGYRKTSISEVAERAGVAKGTVYLYFLTKPDLLVHAIAEEKRRFIVRLKPILAPKLAPRERLKAWIRMALVTGVEMPLTSKVLGGDPDIMNVVYEYMNQNKERHWKEVQEDFIRHLVVDAVGPGVLTDAELSDRSNVLFGMIHSALVFANPAVRRGLSTERFAELVSTMIVEGIGASTGEGARPRGEEV